MKKYTLEELLEKDMIMIPDPDMSFMLGELTGVNFMGLQEAGGVYIMIHEPTDQVIYVGVSRVLGQRLACHKSRGKKAGTIRYKISEALGDAEADNQINNEIKVHIILESDENYQEIFENVLIKKYNPVYNIVGKQGGRGATKGQGLREIPIKEIVEMYEAGKSTVEIAKVYGVSRSALNKRLKDAGAVMRDAGDYIKVELPIKEILEKYRTGKTTTELGKEYGVSVSTIRGRLKDAGAVMGDAGGSKKLELPVKEIIEKYLAGKSTTELGKEYEVSAFTIRNRLKDAGVGLRGAVFPTIDLPLSEIIEKYLAGKSTAELGKECGVGYATINRRLKDAGVRMHKNVTKRKQLNAHLIDTVELEQLELNTLELAGA